jgi:protein-L-isoaspartate(D-aspartate) O-methyltransferase
MAVDFAAERDLMVAEQLEARGIGDRRVLDALRRVPRHLFVAPQWRDRAYDDMPLPIGEGQTISQPYMVALMTQTLAVVPGERVLEVGTGSGYEAAVLAELGARVVTVERLPAVAARARELLDALGYEGRVTVEVGDGTLGWPAGAPYDGIVVSAAGPGLPRPLVDQLASGGRLVLPIGEEELQTLVCIRRDATGLAEEYLGECRFVKLIGDHGWEES